MAEDVHGPQAQLSGKMKPASDGTPRAPMNPKKSRGELSSSAKENTATKSVPQAKEAKIYSKSAAPGTSGAITISPPKILSGGIPPPPSDSESSGVEQDNEFGATIFW